MTNSFLNSSLGLQKASTNEKEKESFANHSKDKILDSKDLTVKDKYKKQLLAIKEHFSKGQSHIQKEHFSKAIVELNQSQHLIENLSTESFLTDKKMIDEQVSQKTKDDASLNPSISYIKRFEKIVELSVRAIGRLYTELDFEPASRETVKKPIRSVKDLQRITSAEAPPRLAKEATILKQSEIIKKAPQLLDKEAKNEELKREIVLPLASKEIKFKFYDMSFADNVKLLSEAYQVWSRDNQELVFDNLDEFVLQLPFLSAFVIPLSLADSFYALGDYRNAEKHYRSSLNYPFINGESEGKTLWLKIAKLYFEMGNSEFKNNNTEKALDYYSFIMPFDNYPASFLYNDPNFKLIGEEVKGIIEKLIEKEEIPNNPSLVIFLLQTLQQIKKIENKLNYYGDTSKVIPVLSSSYLQDHAQYFCQEARIAEEQYYNIQEMIVEDKGSRHILGDALGLFQREFDLAEKLHKILKKEALIIESSYQVAQERAASCKDILTAYEKFSSKRNMQEANNAWYTAPIKKRKNNLGGHENKALLFINPYENVSWHYEMTSLEKHLAELTRMAEKTSKLLHLSKIKLKNQEFELMIAQEKIELIKKLLKEYDSQSFTRERWAELLIFLKNSTESHLRMATRFALLLENTYNYQYSKNFSFIKEHLELRKSNYLLSASDSLFMDLEKFNYFTLENPGNMTIKQSISLAEKYPFAFEESFRKTGILEFQTRAEDFDQDYPGTYLRQIQAVEIIIEGLLPKEGIKGFLSNDGLGRIKTKNQESYKDNFHERVIIPLSNYTKEGYSLVYSQDSLDIDFHGASLCGSWKLEIPKSSNDLDFDYLRDIKLVFHYTCLYDDQLAQKVKEELPRIKGINSRQKYISLQNVFPQFYSEFLKTGRFKFRISEDFFPYNQKDFKIDNVGLILREMVDKVYTLSLKTPDHDSNNFVKIITNTLNFSDKEGPWSNLLGNSALGYYEIIINKNPQVKNESLQDIILILDYSFTKIET